MTTQPLHPDHLKPGHMVGPGTSSRCWAAVAPPASSKWSATAVFYALKAYLLPLSGNREELSEKAYVEEASTYRKLSREAAALFTYASHPNLLRVHAVDFWPNPHQGYGYLVTDFVDGDTWHEWRWKTAPSRHQAGGHLLRVGAHRGRAARARACSTAT